MAIQIGSGRTYETPRNAPVHEMADERGANAMKAMLHRHFVDVVVDRSIDDPDESVERLRIRVAQLAYGSPVSSPHAGAYRDETLAHICAVVTHMHTQVAWPAVSMDVLGYFALKR